MFFKIFLFTFIFILGCKTVPEDTTDTDIQENIIPDEEETEVEEQTDMPFVVTEEIYNRVFNEMKALIEELNNIILNKDYESWCTYLTEEYIEKTSSPEYLAKFAEEKTLKEQNIQLKTLKDYFDYLVVPRRKDVTLDSIEFIDEFHVYAYTLVMGRKYLLYYFIKEPDGWKIGFY